MIGGLLSIAVEMGRLQSIAVDCNRGDTGLKPDVAAAEVGAKSLSGRGLIQYAYRRDGTFAKDCHDEAIYAQGDPRGATDRSNF